MSYFWALDCLSNSLWSVGIVAWPAQRFRATGEEFNPQMVVRLRDAFFPQSDNRGARFSTG